MSDLPLWLLDVDGVINAISKNPDSTVWPRDQWMRGFAKSSDGVTWPMLAARPVLRFITEVHERGLAEIRWHTTWRHDAVTVIAPLLGLPEFPVEYAPEVDAPFGWAGSGENYRFEAWWKLPAAERELEAGRRLIWTDDDLEHYSWRANRTYLPAPLGASGNTLLIAPQVRLGLTPKHVASISDFIGYVPGEE